MKKVALNYIYLSRKHVGGKDQVGLNLLKGFQENGVAKNMCVICYDYSVETIRKISGDIEIISISSPNQKTEMRRMIGNLLTNTFIIPSIIQEYKIDVLYHLDCNNGLRKFGIKSVVIPHDIKAISHRDLPGLHIPFYKYWLYKVMYALDFKHADTIVAISNVDKEEIQEYYPQYKDKVIRIYDPIDIPVCPCYIENREPNIVAINLQFHHKNIITLIKAFEKIKNQIEEDLVLVGNVPDRVVYLKKYVEEHNLSDRVHFTGFVNEEERNHILQHCKLYVSPTLFEGFGMVSVEAIILGVPTLISKIPTNLEVTQGLCAYYEPAEDVNALAKAMLCELKKTIDKGQTEMASRQIHKSYNYKTICQEYWSLFQQIQE